MRPALVVFAVALLVRVVYLLEFSGSIFFTVPILDAAWHVDLAQRVAAGNLLEGAPYFRAPLYTWFLALAKALFGDGAWPPRLAQALLGAGAAALVTLATALLLGPGDHREGGARRAAPLAAGLVVALYGPLVFSTGELLHEALLVPLVAGALAAAAWGLNERDDPDAGATPWFLAGLLVGLAAITRPNALVLAPALALAPRFVPGGATPAGGSASRGAPSAGRHLVPVLVGIVLPILPVTAVNYISSGDLIPIASQGGINLYAGNNPDADGRQVRIPELAESAGWEEFEPRVRELAEQAVGRPLRPSEVSDWWAARGFEWLGANPGAAARLYLTKLGALVSGYEAPNNRDLYLARRDSLLLSFLVGRAGPLFWPWGLLLPLALFGILRPDGGSRALRLPLSAAFLYAASLLPFFICDRFRLPLVPLLAVPAGVGLAALAADLRARKRPPTRALLASAAALAVVLPTWGADTRIHVADAWHKLGEALYNRGEPDRALAAFEEAVAAAPDDPAIRLGRAFSLVAAADSLEESLRRHARDGAPPEDPTDRIAAASGARLDSLAGVEFERLAARLPDSWPAQYGWGLWLFRHGRAAEAVPFLERAAGSHPGKRELHRDLGFAYEAAGLWREAGLALNHALRLGESSAELHLSLGLAALQGGAADLAENNWRRGLELDPNHFRLLYNMGLLAFGRGRDDEAADLWRRAGVAQPGHPLIPWQEARLAARRGDNPLAERKLAEAIARGIPLERALEDPLLAGFVDRLRGVP
jgi:tetratricopeptide (TPR) repeat protein